MKLVKRIAALLTAVWLVLFAAMFACSAEVIDHDRCVTLTISYTNEDNVPISGAEFSIYMVATADEYGNLTTTENFKDYNVNIEDGDDDAWKTLATTLEGYVLRDKILPTDSKKTNDQGLALFPNDGVKLTPGLYLVLGTRHTQNKVVYETLPFMIMMPMQDRDSKEWNYDVAVSPKYETHPQDETDKVTCKVLKVWKDEGNEANRPKEVVVQLLCDGEIYDTVALNKDNNWRYKWSDLDIAYQWRVVEKELKGYTVEVSRQGVTFVITNTCTENIPTEPVTPSSPDGSVAPSVPDSSDTPSVSTPNDTTLPQTGQLWWPVPLLVVAGLLMILVGLIIFRGINNEEN